MTKPPVASAVVLRKLRRESEATVVAVVEVTVFCVVIMVLLMRVGLLLRL